MDVNAFKPTISFADTPNIKRRIFPWTGSPIPIIIIVLYIQSYCGTYIVSGAVGVSCVSTTVNARYSSLVINLASLAVGACVLFQTSTTYLISLDAYDVVHPVST